jgi:hypothetical protein
MLGIREEPQTLCISAFAAWSVVREFFGVDAKKVPQPIFGFFQRTQKNAAHTSRSNHRQETPRVRVFT